MTCFCGLLISFDVSHILLFRLGRVFVAMSMFTFCCAFSGDQIRGHWSEERVIEEDWLLPYRFHHGPRHSNRYVRRVQPDKYDNVTYEVAPPHRSDNASEPVVERRQFVQAVGDYWAKTTVRGHYFRVSNPHKTVSVLEPRESHGCDHDMRETVKETSEKINCLAAVNAGFFNTTSGACIGNVHIFLMFLLLQNISTGLGLFRRIFFLNPTDLDPPTHFHGKLGFLGEKIFAKPLEGGGVLTMV